MCFLAFEGMDGAGKTSTSEATATALLDLGYDVLYVNKKNVHFENGYVRAHMAALRNLIWYYDQDAPLPLLGDLHWLHLMSSWFYTLDEGLIRPNLSKGRVVIADSWCYKFLARFMLKGPLRAKQALEALSHLSKPDMTVFLEVEPEEAARRKAELTMAECGNMDGYSGLSHENFISYQSRIQTALRTLASRNAWFTINTTSLPADQVAKGAVEAFRAFAAHRRRSGNS